MDEDDDVDYQDVGMLGVVDKNSICKCCTIRATYCEALAEKKPVIFKHSHIYSYKMVYDGIRVVTRAIIGLGNFHSPI